MYQSSFLEKFSITRVNLLFDKRLKRAFLFKWLKLCSTQIILIEYLLKLKFFKISNSLPSVSILIKSIFLLKLILFKSVSNFIVFNSYKFPFFLFSDLASLEENLLIGAKENSKQKQTFHLKEIYNFFPLLKELKNRDAGLLSGGEQQMLSIARTLMGNPDVLLLDEPSEGLAPIIVQDIAKLIKNLQNTEVTIIIAEQNIKFCFAIADNAAIIDKGTIVYENTISELKKDTKTLKKYLAV